MSRIAEGLGIDLGSFGADGAVVVGSNGKGSTAAMAAALLQQTGRSVGLFTSPHLLALNERFRIEGEDISDEELALQWERVAAAAEAAGEAGNLGGFEFLFLIAAAWFKARGCAYTVWEAGIGGRLDPVRLINAQRVALTSLDFEHTYLLGDTLADIAAQKIDAAPAGARLFVSESCADERAAIEAHCGERGVALRFLPALAGASPLAGAHQGENAALARALACDAATLTEAQVRAGFAAVRWPGRLEMLETSPLVVIDVGHTPAGVRCALEGFEVMRAGRKAVLVCGVSADKDSSGIVAALAPRFDVIVCAAAHHKGAPAAVIAAHAAAAHPQAEIIIAEGIADARRIALARSGAEGAVYVAGGVFLAAEFKAVHLGIDPAALVFF
ncbi:MAG: hypothetical protein JNJ63_04045 [Hyphomonadaceae bacterium]|nr:hypothetical protein [Hyphomonadaceae bacterium]